MSTTQRRTARKSHRCTCGHIIKPGDIYLSHTIFPGDDAHHYVAQRPFRGAECAYCAERYGRDHLLEPLPEAQAHEVYLNAMREGRG